MKATVLFIFMVAATLQVSAQANRLGYHRYDGTYVEPRYSSFSDGYIYDSWCCTENTSYKKSAIPKRYSYTNRKSNPERVARRSVYSYPSRTSYSNYYNYPSNRHYYDSGYSTYYVNTGHLNVRSGPSSSYSQTGTLSYADRVDVIDSYSNGWKRIQYSYFDAYSSSFKTKYGYVAGNYLSTSNTYKNYDYSYRNNYIYNDNYKYRSNVYSTIDKREPDYGNVRIVDEVDTYYGSGGISIWTDCGTDGEIKVYLDDVYVGSLTYYFTNEIPKCGEEGTLFIEKKPGTYTLVAQGEKYTWKGTVTITKNKCLIQGLER